MLVYLHFQLPKCFCLPEIHSWITNEAARGLWEQKRCSLMKSLNSFNKTEHLKVKESPNSLNTFPGNLEKQSVDAKLFLFLYFTLSIIYQCFLMFMTRKKTKDIWVNWLEENLYILDAMKPMFKDFQKSEDQIVTTKCFKLLITCWSKEKADIFVEAPVIVTVQPGSRYLVKELSS